MLKKLLETNAKLVSKRPKLVLITALVLTVLAALGATNLSMELSWVSLAPDNSPAVEEYQDIIDNFPSLDSIVVLVESDDYEMLEQATNEAAEKVEGLDEYVTSVVAGVDKDFMLENGMVLMGEEAEMMGYVFADANVDSMYSFVYMMMDETTKSIAEGDLTDEEIAYSASMISGITALILQSDSAIEDGADKDAIEEAMEALFLGGALLTSPDGKMAMMTIQPSFDMMDEVMLIPGVNAIEEALKEVNDKYDNVTVRGTGMHVVARDEIVTVMNDSYVATILSILLILIVLYFAFRLWVAPIFTVAPLLFGIVWSMGIVGIIIGRLNMMTVFAVAMLLGLGVDYAIHMYSSYTERRAKGIGKDEAVKYSICHTGPSIIVGALTTAVAFFALNVSSLNILSELGTIMGVGIITTLAAVFWILPSFIMIKKEKEKNMKKVRGNYKAIGWIAKGVYKYKYIVLIILVLGAVFMGYQATKIEFDMNLMNLEPEGLESIELMEHMVEKYDTSSTSFAIQVDSLDEVYELTEKLEAVEGVSEVTSVASILPEASKQQKTVDTIEEINKMLDTYRDEKRPVDIAALQQILVGLQEAADDYENTWLDYELGIINQDDFDELNAALDNLSDKLSEDYSQDNLESLADALYEVMSDMESKMMSADVITPDDLPQAYKSQFVSKDGSKFLLTIYSEFDIWEALGKEQGNEFLADIQEVDERVTGTPIFMMALYNAVGDELLKMGIILICVLLTILLVHFRSIKYALLAFLPLAFTLVYMLGTMSLLNIQFNMINFLVILLIIGIGLDDGVHILHHYKEGERDMKILFSTIGRAILLTTITTVFGFGSLSFSSYRGIAGLGVVLAIGVSMALIFTIIVLPIFLKDETGIKA